MDYGCDNNHTKRPAKATHSVTYVNGVKVRLCDDCTKDNRANRANGMKRTIRPPQARAITHERICVMAKPGELAKGDKVRATAQYSERYVAANGVSRLAGLTGTVVSIATNGSVEVDFGVSAPATRKKTYPTWILSPELLELAE